MFGILVQYFPKNTPWFSGSNIVRLFDSF